MIIKAKKKKGNSQKIRVEILQNCYKKSAEMSGFPQAKFFTNALLQTKSMNSKTEKMQKNN